MKKAFSFIVLALFAMSAVYAGGTEGKISGVISGAHCGAMGMACSATHDLRRAELPGVFTKDNKFYFVANVPQTFLAQWPVKDVSVEGTIYENERVIDAKKISVQDGEKSRVVFEDGNIVDEMGHKEKLSAAVEIGGKWYCADCAMMQKKTK